MQPTQPRQAAAAILFAMLLIGFIDSFVYLIAEEGGLWQFHAMRSALSVPLIVLVARLGGGSLRANRLWAVAGRSFFIGTAMILYFGSLAFMSVAEAAAGLFTSPIFVLLISVIFLGQRVGALRLAAVATGFAGTLLVLRPEAGGFGAITLMPIVAGLFYAIGAIATRSWCAGESTMSMLLWSFIAMGSWGLVGLATLGIWPLDVPAGAEGFILRGWVTPGGTFLFWTAVQAVGSVIAVHFIIRAYQLGEASFVAIFEYSLLIFVAFWAFILKGEVIDAPGALGIALIIGSGAVIALRSR